MRFALLILIGVCALFLPLWCYIIVSLVYLLRYEGVELLLIAVLVDAHFGTPMTIIGYQYTLSTAVCVVSAYFIKPYVQLS